MQEQWVRLIRVVMREDFDQTQLPASSMRSSVSSVSSLFEKAGINNTQRDPPHVPVDMLDVESVPLDPIKIHSLSAQEMDQNNQNAYAQFETMLTFPDSESQLVKEPTWWVLLLDAMQANTNVSGRGVIGSFQKLQTIVANAMQHEKMSRFVHMDRLRQLLCDLPHEAYMLFLRAIGFVEEDGQLDLPIANTDIISKAMQVLNWKLALLEMYCQLDKLWRRCVETMNQHPLYAAYPDQLHRCSKLDVVKSHEDYMWLLDKFEQQSDDKINSSV